MIRPHRACGIVVIVASLVVAVPRGAHASAPSDDPTAILAEADAAHEAGKTAEAAELYIKAYKAMSADERKMLGEVPVRAALEDLRATWQATKDTSYVEAAASLLATYQTDVDEVPSEIAAHRTWIDEAGEADAGVSEDPFEDPSSDDDGGDIVDDPDDKPQGEREIAGPVLLGVGLAGVIGGAVMLGLGRPLGPDASENRETARMDPRYPMLSMAQREMFDADLDAYVASERKRGRGIMIGGGILLAVGVGVATYGIVRIVRHRKGSTAAALAPIPGGFAF